MNRIVVDKNNYNILAVDNFRFFNDQCIVISNYSNTDTFIPIDFVDIITVDTVLDGMKYYKDNKFYQKYSAEIENEKNIIQEQLAQLDLIVPRIVEDIIAQQQSLIIHQNKLDIMSQKEALREQLRVLSL